MECPSCKADVPEGNRFCEACGAPAPTLCPSCGAPARSGARFCGKCGRALTFAASPSETSQMRASPLLAAPTEAERRQLTVMFCDLVGSTPLSTRFDPEDLREIVGAYHRCVTDTVGRFGGFVAKYMGDGVLVYFGYPEAHEDDAERAARAGLAVIDAVGRLATQEPLNVRLGIATGLVVVGDLIGAGAAQERGVVGETPNLAARLQALARPGTLVVADATRRQIGTLFEIEDLGPQPLAGFAEPQRAWRVVGESGVVSRFEALRSRTTPLVGRDEELDLLTRRWQQAKLGEGRVVLVSGEPGIGKSRLTVALSQRIETEPHTRLRYFCSPHHQDSALYPFIGQLERAAGFTRDDTNATRLDKLEALLGDGAEPGDLSLLAEMLSLSGSERFPPLDLSPQRKKERTLAALRRQLQALARRQPILMIFEDLHWIDPTSREVLDLTVEKITELPVLMVATYRPEFQPPWVGGSQVTVIALNRLGRSEGATLVYQLAGNLGALPPDIVDEIVERTDGVPLFVEELTKAVVEAGADRGYVSISAVPPSSLAVPATLHASLLGRLDRLGPAAKNVAQVGAAIGREFSHELLAAAVRLAEPDLQEALRRLVEAGLVFQRGAPPAAEYLFKHALVQDTAYSTLLRGPRQALHRRIAATLQERFPDRVASEPEALARHFSEALQPDRAWEYWLEAGRRAAERSANPEAIGHLTKALQTLELLPESAERDRQELTIRNTIATPLIAMHGYASPEAGVAFNRARVLSGRLGDASALFATLSGEWAFHYVRGDHRMMREVIDEAESAAKRRRNEPLDLVAYRCGGQNALYFGEFEAARDAFETILRTYDPSRHRPPAVHYIHDTKLYALTYLPVIYWILGYPDQARTSQSVALDYAGGLAQAAVSTFVRIYGGAGLDELLLDAPAVRNHADAIIDLAGQHSLGYFRMGGQISKAWAMARQGEGPAGLELMRRSATERSATGATWWQIRYLCMLAETCGQHDRDEEGLAAVAEATELMERTHGHIWKAELTRIEGELRRQQREAAGEIEARFQKSLSIARDQNARAFELRAAMSLARLWREQGRRDEAHDLLAALYAWFTEGFDTPDLKDAKRLLDELA
ncbi:MAG: AAA family ATPase [Alphaproteobacteria bacterium]|nr:AAA family ATPase [Alphaproteobacteria bacterium]